MCHHADVAALAFLKDANPVPSDSSVGLHDEVTYSCENKLPGILLCPSLPELLHKLQAQHQRQQLPQQLQPQLPSELQLQLLSQLVSWLLLLLLMYPVCVEMPQLLQSRVHAWLPQLHCGPFVPGIQLWLYLLEWALLHNTK